jgi:hypothetical protein
MKLIKVLIEYLKRPMTEREFKHFRDWPLAQCGQYKNKNYKSTLHNTGPR